MTSNDDIEREQEYFDQAAEARERMRAATDAAPAAAAHSGAASGIRRQADRYLATLGGAGEAVAVGRFDPEDDRPMYLGKHAIFGVDGDPLVINWQVRAAEPFYKATVANPMGLVRKRQYTTAGNQILNFEDLMFADLAEQVGALDGGPVVDDALLSELDRSRSGEMHEIVQTIQAAQYDIIQLPLDRVLVVQGGPGTGKTVVALHRVSWLLYNHRTELAPSEVLILGPSRPFIRYIRGVLPSLGDQDVVQTEVTSLGPNVRRGREEATDVTQLKGGARMAELLRRAVRERVRVPEEQIAQQVGARRLVVDGDELQTEVDRVSAMPYSAGRVQIRSWLVAYATRELRMSEEAVRQPIEQLLERIWPQHTPQSFLQELYASRDRLLQAAGNDFTAREVQLLQRGTSSRGLRDEVWSDADMALLDELNELIGTETIRSYRLIVVDEAQDLSPMQLRAICRRSTGGAMTLLGDIAQSTGAWARDSWDDLLQQLPTDLPHLVEELRYGYRVPREIFDVAATLLPIAAPTVRPPEIVRTAGWPPEFVRVDASEVGGAAVAEAMGYSSHGLSVGIICPDAHRVALEHALEANGVNWQDAGRDALGSSINVVRPIDAKGLEFDAVVVVEPEALIAEDERGHRLLYVALTRATKRLSVVHSTSEAIPLVGPIAPLVPVQAPKGGQPPTQSPERRAPRSGDVPSSSRRNRIIGVVAAELADEIRATIQPDQWQEVLDAIEHELRLSE